MGRAKKLVNTVYDRWPIEAFWELPDNLRGLYVLYNVERKPVRVGIAGKGRQDVKSRLKNYYRQKKYRDVDTFSVYILNHSFKKHEAFILHALGGALTANIKGGKLDRTTKREPPPRYKRLSGEFVIATVKDGGIIERKKLKKYAGTKVRIDVSYRA